MGDSCLGSLVEIDNSAAGQALHSAAIGHHNDRFAGADGGAQLPLPWTHIGTVFAECERCDNDEGKDSETAQLARPNVPLTESLAGCRGSAPACNEGRCLPRHMASGLPM